MTRTGQHDTGVAEESAFFAFNHPAAEAMLTVSHCVAVKLCVALAAADRSSVVMHHHRICVHGGKRIPVGVLATAKPSARRDDDHSGIIHDYWMIFPLDHIRLTTRVRGRCTNSRRA